MKNIFKYIKEFSAKADFAKVLLFLGTVFLSVTFFIISTRSNESTSPNDNVTPYVIGEGVDTDGDGRKELYVDLYTYPDNISSESQAIKDAKSKNPNSDIVIDRSGASVGRTQEEIDTSNQYMEDLIKQTENDPTLVPGSGRESEGPESDKDFFNFNPDPNSYLDSSF